MLPFNKNSKEKARKLRRNMTLAEKKIWYQLLVNDGLNGLRFLRQKPIDQYIVDFYCHQLKLVIEIDGESHLAEDAKEYDEVRTKVLNGYGIEVIRYTNDQILNRFGEVEADLRKRVNPPAPLCERGFRSSGIFLDWSLILVILLNTFDIEKIYEI